MRLMSGNNAFQQGNGLDMQYLNTPAISTLVARLCRRTVRKGCAFSNKSISLLRGYASRRRSLRNLLATVSVRRSLTALCGGKAAMLDD